MNAEDTRFGSFTLSFYDQLSDPVIFTDSKGSILALNKSAQKKFKNVPSHTPIVKLFPDIIVENLKEEEIVPACSVDGHDYLLSICMSTQSNVSAVLLRSSKLEQEKQHRYQSLFEQNSSAIYAIDRNGTILDINAEGERATGYKKDELIGHSIHKLIYEEDLPAVEELRERVYNGEHIEYEIPIQTKDCVKKHMRVKNIPIVVQDEIIGMYGIAKNITKQKITEEALKISNERYRLLVEHSPDAIAIHRNGKIVYVNEAGVKLVSATDHCELIGKSIYDFLHEDSTDIVQKRLSIPVDDAAREEMIDLKLKGKDGSVVDVQLKAIPFEDKDTVQIVIREVTEQKKAKRELEDSEQRYKSLFQNNPDSMYSIGLDGKLLSVNPACEKVTGYTIEELKAQDYENFIASNDKERVKKIYKSIMGGATRKFHKTIIHKKGHRVDMEAIGFPMIVDGRIVGVYGIMVDITHQKKTEELLRKSDKLSVVGQLAAAVAHEIRNPLTALKGFIQLLYGGLDGKGQYYQIMLSELSRIETIISELLVLAKPQAVVFEEKNIHYLLSHVVTLLESQANLQNVQIFRSFGAYNPILKGEENQLKQVFINVMKNAIEAMPRGGRLIIETTLEQDKYIGVRFKDSGEGIPKERLANLGEPFYTTKEKGTGLGLMISYKIIKEHNGMIEIKSEEGKGTTVEVLFPVVQTVEV
ncbi:PAS domain S-box protein [Pseudalkalibacillus caeni]|uniref:histidine kinase n=1 Tax=Exobacillus caeni TaxID=2574798 RepID=A0A5R9F2G9_9BACL|nr:PAS domain S-box protein [Pseudalkalibacillus caeni]TLS36680.1 PAS domain S-box protein [Pseudalkalibacillus caeni]